MKYIVLDTETTGLKRMPKGRIVEPTGLSYAGDSVVQLGAVVADENFGIYKAICVFNDVVKAYSDPKAEEVNGLNLSVIRSRLSGVTLAQNIEKYLPEFYDPHVCFIGYNIDFDMDMIAQTTRNYRVVTPPRKYMIPRRPQEGRITVDIAEYFAKTGAGGRKYHSKLVDACRGYEDVVQETFGDINRMMFTNFPELYKQNGNGYHSALYDSVATYCLWRARVCPIWK